MLQITRRPVGRNKYYSEYPEYSRQLTLSGELHGDRTAAAAGITATGYTPALNLCRLLLAAGHDPRTKLNLFRKSGTLALTVRSIGEGAQLRIHGDGTRFVRTPERPERRRAAPPMRGNEPAAGGDRANPSDASDDGCPS